MVETFNKKSTSSLLCAFNVSATLLIEIVIVNVTVLLLFLLNCFIVNYYNFKVLG